MKTFDYESAWKELALPAYKGLPNAVLCLIEETSLVTDELHQLPDCSMPWPEDGGKLREMFNRLDSEKLSRAAQVANYYGHWRPSASIAGDAPQIKGGAHWKFSHYADQVLRERLGIPYRDSAADVSFQIHEGTIRVCYSSPDTWTWHEVAPATEAGKIAAEKIAAKLRNKVAGKTTRNERDNAAWQAMEEIKKVIAWPDWNTGPYMVEESELELRRAERMPKPDKEKLIAGVTKEFNNKVANLTTERDGELWLINHDLPTNNAIYYNHTGRWCFGWSKPITGEARTTLLQKLAKFPFDYDVK